MSDKLYKSLIGRLAENKPEPHSARDLSDNIMQNLPERKRLMLWTNGSEKTAVIQVFRILTTTAALFLIGFFILQQKDIEMKLTLLEKQVATSGKSFGTASSLTIEAGYSKEINRVIDTSSMNLVISRKSLNYLLGRIKSLEDENKSLQQRFIEANQIELKNEKP